jgi:rod shape-determining protein MreC
MPGRRTFFHAIKKLGLVLATLWIGLAVWYQGTTLLQLYALRPLQKSVYLVTDTMQALRYWFIAQKELHDQVERQRKLIADLTSELVQVSACINYDVETEPLRSFSKRYRADLAICAQVIDRLLGPHDFVITVDVGSKQGVKEGMVAVWYAQLLGIVTNVYPSYARIRLLFDKQSFVPGITTRTGGRGIVQGGGNGELSFAFASHLDHFEAGDLVISSGEGMLVPAGFGLGSIRQAHRAGCCAHVELLPLFDPRQVSWCYLLEKGALLPEETITPGAAQTP